MISTAWESKTGLFKCATCLETCAEPGALRKALAERDHLLVALKAILPLANRCVLADLAGSVDKEKVAEARAAIAAVEGEK